MENENNDVCEKIINELDCAFDRDENLATFEIINSDENQNKNKSPVIHVEHHLGLESWCVHHVYRHAHDVIFAASKKHPKQCVHLKNAEGRSAISSHSGKCTAHQSFSTNLVKYLNCAILINPDVATFWNCRRRLFEKNRMNIRKEFQFSTLVLSKKPKSNDAFSYRRWLYSFQSHESNDWARELSLCERCATKTLSNYQAWCHRQWVLQKAPCMLQYEWATTERFIRRHIGDYNAYHHRQFVLRKLYEFGYVQSIDPKSDPHQPYKSLARLFRKLGVIDADCGSDARVDLVNAILPANESRENAQIRTLLFCLNLAAGDLDFVDELRELFGHREAFACHRKAMVQFIFDKLAEWSMPIDDQPHVKLMKANDVAGYGNAASNTNVFERFRQFEMENGNELHRKWCDLFLKK